MPRAHPEAQPAGAAGKRSPRRSPGNIPLPLPLPLPSRGRGRPGLPSTQPAKARRLAHQLAGQLPPRLKREEAFGWLEQALAGECCALRCAVLCCRPS